MSVATRDYLFTIDDFLRMGELGIIAPERRVELLDGRIYEMSPIGERHAWAVNQLVLALMPTYQASRAIPSPQNVLMVGDSLPQPDFVLLAPSARSRGGLPSAEDALLVVEIADTSLGADRGSKAQLYAAAGIREYWIVNLVDNVVEVHRHPDPAISAWMDRHLYKVGDSISPLSFPDVAIPVDGLF